jgi:hypothetical protein
LTEDVRCGVYDQRHERNDEEEDVDSYDQGLSEAADGFEIET